MSIDPIFSAAGFMEATWAEIAHLRDGIPELFASHGIAATYFDQDWNDDDYCGNRTAYLFHLSGAIKRQRKPSQLVLYFDLFRPGFPTEWRFGQHAALLVAYSPNVEDGWELRQLYFGTDGIFDCEESRMNLIQESTSGGRLLHWADGYDLSAGWARMPWLFALPLSHLSDPETVEREVITPVARLIAGSGTATEIFSHSGAIVWPHTEQ